MTDLKTSVYLACPFHAPEWPIVVARKRAASLTTMELISQGHTVICPLTSGWEFHNLNPGWSPPAGWYEYDLKLIDLVEEVHVLCIPGFAQSTGVKLEIDYAEDTKKKVHFITKEKYTQFLPPTLVEALQ